MLTVITGGVRRSPVAGSRAGRNVVPTRWAGNEIPAFSGSDAISRQPGRVSRDTAARLRQWQALLCRWAGTGGSMGDGALAARRRQYGVRLVRGPFVRLPAHPETCADEGAFLS